MSARYSVARPNAYFSHYSSTVEEGDSCSQSEEIRERVICADRPDDTAGLSSSVSDYLSVANDDEEFVDLRSWIGDVSHRVSSSEKQRWHIVREIRESEASYLRSLESVKAKFVEPLRSKIDSGNCFLDERHVRVLFYQWEMLIGMHTELLRLLDDRLSRWSQESCVADVLVDFLPVFYTYSTYFSNYSQATEVLDQLKQHNNSSTTTKSPRWFPVCVVPKYQYFLYFFPLLLMFRVPL